MNQMLSDCNEKIISALHGKSTGANKFKILNE